MYGASDARAIPTHEGPKETQELLAARAIAVGAYACAWSCSCACLSKGLPAWPSALLPPRRMPRTAGACPAFPASRDSGSQRRSSGSQQFATQQIHVQRARKAWDRPEQRCNRLADTRWS